MVMKRRELLKLGAASALFQATSPLLAATQTETKKPFRDQLIDKYLKVAKIKLAVGAEKPFSAIHFSDTHVSNSDALDILEGNERSLILYEARRPRFPISVQTLAATIAYGEKHGHLMLNTGDLFDYRSNSNIDCIANSFAGRNIFSALGNHESYGHHTREMNPSTPAAALELRKRFEKAYGHPLLVASRVVNGVNFVAFDNGGLERWFRKERLAAIKAEFAKGLPTVLMSHIPPDTPEVRAALEERQSKRYKKTWKLPRNASAWLMTEGSDAAFMNELRAHADQIKAYLCGHLHIDWQGEWNGFPLVVVAGNFEGRLNEIEFT